MTTTRVQARTHLRKVGTFLLVCVLVGITAIFLATFVDNACRSTKELGRWLLWAAASAATGGLVGFLFGIPKRRPEAPGEEPANETSRYEQNTNLEEISDWLTKIIVGVGLTQLLKLPTALWSLATLVAGPNEHLITIALAVTAYFCVVGFLAGALLTRLFLLAAFNAADADADRTGGGAEMAAVDRSYVADAVTPGPRATSVSLPTSAVDALSRLPLEELKTRRDFTRWAKAMMVKERYHDAEAAWRRAIALEPDVAAWYHGLAASLSKQRRFEDAIAVLDTGLFYSNDKWDRLIRKALVFNCLHVDNPKRALDLIDDFERRFSKHRSSRIYVYKAVALGQLYRREGDKQDREDALEAVRQALAISTAWRTVLLDMLDPASDLEVKLDVFDDDDEFRTTIESAPTSP